MNRNVSSNISQSANIASPANPNGNPVVTPKKQVPVIDEFHIRYSIGRQFSGERLLGESLAADLFFTVTGNEGDEFTGRLQDSFGNQYRFALNVMARSIKVTPDQISFNEAARHIVGKHDVQLHFDRGF